MLRKFQQPGKMRLVSSSVGGQPRLVIDHEIAPERGEIIAMLRQRGAIDMQDDMPTHCGNTGSGSFDRSNVRLRAEMPDEIETRAAQTCGIKCMQFGIAGSAIDQADTPVSPAAACNRSDHCPVIAAINRWLDENRATEAELSLQRLISLKRRLGRFIGPVGLIGELVWRAKNVAMRIAGSGRQLHHVAITPPSIEKFAPVTQRDSSDAR